MKAFLFLLTLPLSILCSGQDTSFQQHVDYIITGNLDTREDVLRGSWEMTYHNNSPNALEELVVHLYPNAYSNRSTAFARQQLHLGKTDFQFAHTGALGRIDSLDFKTGPADIAWHLDPDNPDIAYLHLPEPLAPGNSITITSPYRLGIPFAFSRLGHIDDTYQISQWYPKPAVYDADGWHPLPYLNQGEYYGEFGSFDVTLTLPSNYIVAATGTLLTRESALWRDSLAAAENPPLTESPPTARTTRTWRFHANNVHDFAWFADKRFAVRKALTRIDDHDVTCWAFFTAVEQAYWERATEYIAHALQFYSREVGAYPFDQMSGVQVPLGADSGMEYPMVTSINTSGSAASLDDVLAHEIGHNWFYGMLGSNERKHPWIDEGINTFYENAYMRERYTSPGEHFILWGPPKEGDVSDEQKAMQFATRRAELRAPDTDPEFSTELQNYFGSYYKPALAFDMLEAYFGEEKFRETMHAFFKAWQYKHPSPEDIEQHFSEACACNLDWLFDGLLGSDAMIDYAITDVGRGMVTVTNKGNVIAPVQLLAYRNTTLVNAMWTEGFTGSRMVTFDTKDADRVTVYDPVFSLDINSWNNVRYLRNGADVGAKLKLRVLGGKAEPQVNYLNIIPAGGWNEADREMLGVALSNTYWPARKLQWGVVPLYAFGPKTLTGVADVRLTTRLPESNWQIEGGLGVKSFHFEQDTHYGFYNRYVKIAPHLTFLSGSNTGTDKAQHTLGYRFIYVRQDYGAGVDFDEFIWEEKDRTYQVHELTYGRTKQTGLVTSDIRVTAHAGKGFVRLAADAMHSFKYNTQGQAVRFHSFAGALPVFNNPEANVGFHFNGIQGGGLFGRDYLYDELLFSRNGTSGFWSQTVFQKDARVRTLATSGISEEWMLGAGIQVETPIPVPVEPYVDVAIYKSILEGKTTVSYSAGLALILRRDVIEAYFPIIESEDIRSSLTYEIRNTFWKRVSIRINLKPLHPFNFRGY